MKKNEKNIVEKAIEKELGTTTGTLANYTIEKKIGQGQFSTVYRAKMNSDNTIVAIKRVPVIYPLVTVTNAF